MEFKIVINSPFYIEASTSSTEDIQTMIFLVNQALETIKIENGEVKTTTDVESTPIVPEKPQPIVQKVISDKMYKFMDKFGVIYDESTTYEQARELIKQKRHELGMDKNDRF